MKNPLSNFVCNINVRVSPDQFKKIKESNINLSEFIRDKLDEEFETVESIAEKEKELQDQLEKIKIQKERINKKPKTENTSETEKKFLEDTKKLINNKPEFLVGRWNKYKNDFGKMIKLEEFKEMIK